jgi:hypothetical protein
MRRLLAFAPLALLSTACAVRGATPSSALEYAGDPSPHAHLVEAPREADAVAGWQLPAESPWSRYEKLTLLTYLGDDPTPVMLPEVTQLPVVQRAEVAAARLAAAGMPPGTLWIVDLRGAASVAFGATLSRALPRRIAPVLTFNNWPAEDEVVPAEETLSALLALRPVLPAAADVDATPVFLLDAFRLSRRDEEMPDDVTDNRYFLLGSDLPDAATLRAQGITRVVYVVEDRDAVSNEEDDLHDPTADFQNAGIGFSMVDLAWFDRIGAAPDWDTNLGYHAVVIGSRFTIFDSPGFFARGRGGFGGARSVAGAHPSVGGGGRSFASPHVSGHGG